MVLYALTTFLSAFLLFLVQPLIGKRILPWFGGTPAVWTTCMLFFQVALLGGYAYAHWISTRLSPRRQIVAHLALLAAALPFLPVYPGAEFKPADPDHPTGRILLLLGLTTLAPYLVLSATSPLLQRWFSLRHPGRSPYVLYALSNAGSLLALPAYVMVVEPLASARTAAGVWAAGFAVFALLCGWCAVGTWNIVPLQSGGGQPGRVPRADEPPPRPATRALWLLLPFAGSALLLAVTNQLCQDTVVMPFLWVLPLGVYLLSFILCFESDRWYRRAVFGPLAAVLAAGVVGLLFEKIRVGFAGQVAIYGGALFALCMVCHGELARLRPAPARLTAFYMMIAVGGALGAVFVVLVAPLLFNTYLELHLALWGCGALGLLAAWRTRRSPARAPAPHLLAAAGLAVLGVFLGLHVRHARHADVFVARNFYGVLRVKEIRLPNPDRRVFTFQHGNTLHGWQLADDPTRPTAYYGPQSGVGLALTHDPRGGARTVGVVGLGIGTLAVYGRPGDFFRFYEINPDVAEVAANGFTYLGQSPALSDIVLGDARLSLEREDGPAFDLLILDAFTGDALPAHLLTREAFAVYRRRLKPGGVIAVNISNNFLDLEPVVRGAGESVGLRACVVASARDRLRVTHAALWMLLSADGAVLDQPEIRRAARPLSARPAVLWTDDRNNLFSILVWRQGMLRGAGGRPAK